MPIRLKGITVFFECSSSEMLLFVFFFNIFYNILCLHLSQCSSQFQCRLFIFMKKRRQVREQARERDSQALLQQKHIKAQLQPRPLLQCVEINWVKKICCLRLKWVMGGSVTIVFCLPEAIYRSFRLSLSCTLNTRLSFPPRPPSLPHHPSTF